MHSVDRAKVARRSLIRVQRRETITSSFSKFTNETTKSGVLPEELGVLVDKVKNLPNLSLRGLMAIPAPETLFDHQRATFARLRKLLQATNREHQTNMDCLSMGMTDDLEAAVAEGATHVRVGTAIFGPRQRPASIP